jgi:hypothetical protein
MLHIITCPSETHESPSQWMNSIFTVALSNQRAKNSVTKGWSYATNSSFCVREPAELVAPKVLVADGCLVDEKHNLLVVVEVAYSQSVRDVLRKVEENWVKAPKILAVIVIKMEESPVYRAPAGAPDKAPTEPVLSQSAWLDHEWPSDDIAYDGHTWYGRSYARFILFIKRANWSQEESTDVCSHSHSFFGNILIINMQILIQPLSQPALDSLAYKRKREHSPAEDSDAHDYGSEVQEPHTEGDEAERDGSQMGQIPEIHDKPISEVSKRLGSDWEIITLVTPSFPLCGVRSHFCRISGPISMMTKEEQDSRAFSVTSGQLVSATAIRMLIEPISLLFGSYLSTASRKPAKSIHTIDTSSIY